MALDDIKNWVLQLIKTINILIKMEFHLLLMGMFQMENPHWDLILRHPVIKALAYACDNV
jgi:hypothetical protein